MPRLLFRVKDSRVGMAMSMSKIRSFVKTDVIISGADKTYANTDCQLFFYAVMNGEYKKYVGFIIKK